MTRGHPAYLLSSASLSLDLKQIIVDRSDLQYLPKGAIQIRYYYYYYY